MLTRCAPMMSPIVKAASLPAYIFAMATAPHDIKLNAACNANSSMSCWLESLRPLGLEDSQKTCMQKAPSNKTFAVVT